MSIQSKLAEAYKDLDELINLDKAASSEENNLLQQVKGTASHSALLLQIETSQEKREKVIKNQQALINYLKGEIDSFEKRQAEYKKLKFPQSIIDKIELFKFNAQKEQAIKAPSWLLENNPDLITDEVEAWVNEQILLNEIYDNNTFKEFLRVDYVIQLERQKRAKQYGWLQEDKKFFENQIKAKTQSVLNLRIKNYVSICKANETYKKEKDAKKKALGIPLDSDAVVYGPYSEKTDAVIKKGTTNQQILNNGGKIKYLGYKKITFDTNSGNLTRQGHWYIVEDYYKASINHLYNEFYNKNVPRGLSGYKNSIKDITNNLKEEIEKAKNYKIPEKESYDTIYIGVTKAIKKPKGDTWKTMEWEDPSYSSKVVSAPFSIIILSDYIPGGVEGVFKFLESRFPFYSEVKKYPNKFPFMIGLAEEKAWPNSEIDILNYMASTPDDELTKLTIERNKLWLENISKYNSFQQKHYEININLSLPGVTSFYSTKPLPGYEYVFKIGWINPAYVLWDRFFYEFTQWHHDKWLKEAFERQQKLDQAQAFLGRAISTFMQIGMLVGTIATGGAAAAIGLASNELGKTELGKTDLGRLFVAVGEAVALSIATNKLIGEAALNAAEKELKSIALKELLKKAGKENDPIARIIGEGIIEASFAGAKGQDWKATFIHTEKQKTLSYIKNEVPYGDVIYGAGVRVYDQGWAGLVPGTDKTGIYNPPSSEQSETLTSALKKSAPALSSTVKNLTKQEAQKAIDLIKEGQMQEAIKEMVHVALKKEYVWSQGYDEISEDAAVIQHKKEIAQLKSQMKAIDAISKGKLPSPEELSSLNPIAKDFYDKVKQVLPDSQVGKGWQLGLEIGLPDLGWDFTLPGVPGLNMPISMNPDVDFSFGFNIPDLFKMGFNIPATGIKTQGFEFEAKELEAIIKEILPIGVALIPLVPPPGKTLEEARTQVHIKDQYGNINIRPALKFSPFEHSMLKYGLAKRKLTKEQIQYKEQRKLEIQKAQAMIAKMDTQVQELQAQLG
jgi:hypothetical protein